jgi:hypothetical protein
MKYPAPDLTFACELEAQPLQRLFANPQVIPFLQATHATVSLGILDLSAERADIVRSLNASGVPVTAWLLLPKDQGYWFNLDNYPQAIARYNQFKAWSQANGLLWARIGLDIEPDLRVLQTFKTNRLAALQLLTQTTFNRGRFSNGVRAYRELIRQIHADGYPVETYQIPFIVDERKAGSQVIQRLAGLVDLPEADREVLMLYSSFMRPWGQGILWSYGRQAQGVGVGITGGGVDTEGVLDTRPLNWAELQTDLLLAYQHSDHIFIFSLEGCVQHNFLPQLCDFNWSQPVQIPYIAAQRAESYRTVFQRGLWLTARPAWLLFGLALTVSAAALIARGRRA